MSDLPEPLTPPDCDLRDFPFMPLEVSRLRDSDLASLPDAEARWANIMSWSASWHQVPAASLPDDDAALCRLLGYGRDVKTWLKVRAAGGLRGWVKCSDGRLYHPVVAEKAIDAHERKVTQRKRSKAGNEARWGRSRGDHKDEPEGSEGSGEGQETVHASSPSSIPQGCPSDPIGAPSSIPQGSQGTGTETGIVEKKETSLRSVAPRGSRLSPDWGPDEESRQFAVSLGLSPDAVAAQFRDYWVAKAGKDAVKLDWSATWRGWCRREAERKPAAAKPVYRNGFYAVAQDLLADDRDRDEPTNPFLALGGPNVHH